MKKYPRKLQTLDFYQKKELEEYLIRFLRKLILNTAILGKKCVSEPEF